MNGHANPDMPHLTIETGEVKWFDPTKGFGFVVVSGFDVDFLLHQHVLQSFGRTSIAEASSIRFSYEHAATGMKIIEVIAVDAPEEVNDGKFAPEKQCISDELVPARVKWFDRANGFGFVNCYGCTDDVYVGIAALKRSALQDLSTGEALCIQIAETEGRKTVYRIHDWAKVAIV